MGFLWVLSTPLAAQWLNYPTKGVPKTPDGRPNLSAPTPRTADGKPDFSGIWEPEHNRPCPPEGCADLEAPQEFVNIGWSLKDGLPYQPWAAQVVKERVATNRRDDPFSYCLPAGSLRMHVVPLLRKIIQAPGLLLILNEVHGMYRQIFTDGRPLPVDPQPSWNGYSTAKWDGDTLVVQTNGFRDGLWLDTRGSPLTDAAKLTERFRRVDYGHLEVEATVDDPKAYTRPWTIKLKQVIALDTDLLDYICVENEKDAPHLQAVK
ncbi:MAG: hypothetical protein C5B51_01105 [Terriglobia bacterium]|nr:MAG: hypothetical protein C5B51_01105 [Terriglobia bacterium]